ncbi:unnamed protein product [Staurois parvus]|uniref:Uncharacterized protein n=1 Tax=Staurois parvus TaxID=386267 RepID=A0ABN9D1D1_9NEOB|nr:unnamed protein product [Staurois parvus]
MSCQSAPAHIMMLAQPCFTVFTEYCGLNSVFGVGGPMRYPWYLFHRLF